MTKKRTSANIATPECLSSTHRPDAAPYSIDSPLAQALVIDAKEYGNVARFMNHSCDGNVTKHVRIK